MKKIGIVGGLGPEATVDYYNRIIEGFKADNNDLNYPEIILYCVNMSVFVNRVKQKEHAKNISGFVEVIDALKRAGADFAAISANTPHMYFEEIKQQSALPLISIVESTCEEVIRLGLKRPGLFGTGFTMNSTFYQKVFNRNGLEVFLPEPEDRETLHRKLFTEIELGIFKPETRQILIGIIQKMVQQQKIDSLILGCTEFPLILNEERYAGVPMINTTQIHVNSIIKQCIE